MVADATGVFYWAVIGSVRRSEVMKSLHVLRKLLPAYNDLFFVIHGCSFNIMCLCSFTSFFSLLHVSVVAASMRVLFTSFYWFGSCCRWLYRGESSTPLVEKRHNGYHIQRGRPFALYPIVLTNLQRVCFNPRIKPFFLSNPKDVDSQVMRKSFKGRGTSDYYGCQST